MSLRNGDWLERVALGRESEMQLYSHNKHIISASSP